MRKITALRFRGGRRKCVVMYLDDKPALTLEAEVVIGEGLQVGQELATDRVEELVKASNFQHCLNVAMHFLSYRPRSEFELRKRLKRRGFDSDSVEPVLSKLREQGLVNDVEFARFWQDNRQTFSPRSAALTRLELRRKGVADEIISEVVGTASDEDSAYQAALGKARRLPLLDYETFRRRLGDYLRRRGFSYGVVSDTVEQLWREMKDDSKNF